MGLFQQAEEKAKRIKMYVYGPSGVGKTVFSLYWPSPAVIDTEGGTDHYGSEFKFDVIQTTNLEKIEEAIDELLENPGDHRTLVIDPFTIVYQMIEDRTLRRLRMRKSNPAYTLQPLDYKVVKADLKGLVNKIIALDMNIIVTARSKPQYSNEEGDFMKIIGQEPDGPRELPFMFDTVLETFINDEGIRTARVIKDRTNKLPSEFSFDYNEVVRHVDVKGVTRKPEVFRQKENLAELSGRNFEVELDGQVIKTAGITAEQLNDLQTKIVDMDQEKVQAKLSSDYKVSSFLDLRSDEATMFLESLDEDQ
ncbi:MAG: AAA family ATPase [Candidatus Hodarchaeales archaeon]|jgi:hypothetical protein